MNPSAEQFRETLSDIISSVSLLRKLTEGNPDRANELLADLKKCENDLDSIAQAFDL